MDEVVSKWGFGSGISLFIVAGVSKQIMVRAFSPLVDLTLSGGSQTLAASQKFFWNSQLPPVGRIFVFFLAIAAVDLQGALLPLGSILATVAVFMVAVYAQSMKVEIPLTFGRIRGHGMRWPLSFLYTSNIPVILIAALLANIQIGAQLLASKVSWPVLSQVAAVVNPPDILQAVIIYLVIMVAGAVVFSIFWVQTSGMDARSQARQILNSGLQIPGFRRDERVLERILKRYISPLTVMGAITVGFLASIADVMGALSRGTGILLAVMIIYKLYEDIAQQHMMDINPAFRKVIGK